MEASKEIMAIEDIRLLVDTFYSRVREDELLGPIFEERLEGKWDEHLAKMYRFWQTLLLGKHTYYGSPLMPHLDMPVEKMHFQQWVMIFHQTVDELFTGEIAEEAKWRGNRMAEMFNYKIDFFRTNSGAIQ
jgi:hemoglobin